MNSRTALNVVLFIRSVTPLLKAARLRRNVLIENEHGFQGKWVAIPREDFDRLRDSLRVVEEVLRQSS